MGICIYNTDINLIIARIVAKINIKINIMSESTKIIGKMILNASNLSSILSISLSQKFLISVTGICSISFRDKVF